MIGVKAKREPTSDSPYSTLLFLNYRIPCFTIAPDKT